MESHEQRHDLAFSLRPLAQHFEEFLNLMLATDRYELDVNARRKTRIFECSADEAKDAACLTGICACMAENLSKDLERDGIQGWRGHDGV